MTVLNHYHAQVCKWLSELGIPYMEEYPVGPYSLDIYVADLNRGVEIDGPYHNKKRDKVRDANILEIEGIEVVRVKVGTGKEQALGIILE